MKRLTQELRVVQAGQEKDVVANQATEDAVSAKEAAETQVLSLTEELSRV